jgi:hypothetical protein
MAEPTTACSCGHPVDCVCGCHGRYCDPLENTCDLDYLPDEGGLTRWGCADCSPGQGAPHLATCAAGIGSTPRPEPHGISHVLPTR